MGRIYFINNILYVEGEQGITFPFSFCSQLACTKLIKYPSVEITRCEASKDCTLPTYQSVLKRGARDLEVIIFLSVSLSCRLFALYTNQQRLEGANSPLNAGTVDVERWHEASASHILVGAFLQQNKSSVFCLPLSYLDARRSKLPVADLDLAHTAPSTIAP